MYFFWVDCEMTGLDTKKDVILELAYIITDKNMNEIARGEYIFHQTPKILAQMDSWCTEQHTKSGLYEKALKSKLSYKMAEKEILKTLNQHTKEKETYFAGNSVYMDTLFIKKQLPHVHAWMHYRLFDITAFKIEQIILGKKLFTKKETHRALSDIEETIKEYFFYKN
jgi:oligoribonuclease